MNMNMDPNAMSSPWFTSAADPNYPSMQQQQHQQQQQYAPQMHPSQQQQPQRFQSPPGSSSGGGISGTVGSSYLADPDDDDYANEPPLLEELGINFKHIWLKTQSVLLPTKQINEHILDDADLAGPLVFCFLFGVCLLLVGSHFFNLLSHCARVASNIYGLAQYCWGYAMACMQAAKVHFGYIYGFGVISCLFMYLLMNLLSPERTIDIYRVCSVLGYCLLPIIALAAVNIVVSVKNLGLAGFALATLCILWSSHTASRFFEKALYMTEQKYLVAYPIVLVYSCFVLITVF